MQRQNIIVLTNIKETLIALEGIVYFDKFQECYGSLKKACIKKNWNYTALVQKKLPIKHEGYIINRVPFE